MPANPYLAEMLLRARRPTFELGLDIRREEEEEFRLEEERIRGMERRERKFGKARGRGRVAGGLLGLLLAGATGGTSLLATAALTGLGSYAGQKVGVGISPGAMKKFKRIAPGKYYVETGREREREFEWGESERDRYINELMLTSAAFDALTGFRVKRYGGGILDMLLGEGAPGTLMGRWTPRAGEF